MSERPPMNNFHAKFPGGFYRREYHENAVGVTKGSLVFPERTEQMFTDLDVTITEKGFDMKKFERERAAWHQAIRTARSQPIDSTASNVLGRLGDARKERVHEMIYPIYKAMLEKGYKHEELTR